MMRGNFKRLASIILAAMCLTLSGCGNGSADYEDLIDKVIEYNHEVYNEYSDSDNLTESMYWFYRDTSNFSIWDDDNNYYVLMQKNSLQSEHLKYSVTDGYKIGKENGRISNTVDDRNVVEDFYQSNETSLYTEKNVELVDGKFDMK